MDDREERYEEVIRQVRGKCRQQCLFIKCLGIKKGI
jgi:hypothetical protein